MFDIPCVIFAGGKSSRMGEDKALLSFGNFDTLTEYQHNRLSKIFKNLYISCKDRSKFHFEADFLEDLENDVSANIFSPIVGFHTIFKLLKAKRVFVISVDTPFIGIEEIIQLLNTDTQTIDATIAIAEDKIQPLCGIYHNSLHNSFQRMLEEDNHKLQYLLKTSDTKYVDFKNKEKFLNLNHPHEYEEALRIVTDLTHHI